MRNPFIHRQYLKVKNRYKKVRICNHCGRDGTFPVEPDVKRRAWLGIASSIKNVFDEIELVSVARQTNLEQNDALRELLHKMHDLVRETFGDCGETNKFLLSRTVSQSAVVPEIVLSFGEASNRNAARSRTAHSSGGLGCVRHTVTRIHHDGRCPAAHMKKTANHAT